MSYPDGIATRLDTAWGTGILGPDGRPWHARPDLAQQRERARRLERESVLAAGILDRSVENVIGTGITVRPKSSSPEFNKEIGELWSQFTDGKTADVRRTYSFSQLQRLAHRHVCRDGDCGFVLVDRHEQGIRFPEIQFVGGEHIQTPWAAPAGVPFDRSRTTDGIEHNDVNAPAAYWIKGERQFSRVEARDFVFLHNANRYNVSRGESKFQGSYRLFDQLDGGIEAVLVAWRVGASAALIRKRKAMPQNAPQTYGAQTTERSDGSPAPVVLMEPGTIMDIGSDDDIVAFNPNQPQQNFVQFVVSIARLLGLKFGLTVERVLLDFSGASYSVSRSTTIQENQAAWPAQDDFNTSFFARVYPFFVAKCVRWGYVKAQAPADAWKYEWVPPGRPLNDTVKEAAGYELLMKLGLAAPEDLATAMGEDWTRLQQTIAKNKREMEAIGIQWPTDAKTATAISAEPATPAPANNPPTTNENTN